MIKFLTSKIKNSNGQVAVIVALMVFSMVGMLVFVIDVGSIYEARRNSQTAADSAALAGAQDLPENPSEASSKAIAYAQQHGNVTLSESDITFSEDYDTITVKVYDDSTPLFSQVFLVLTQQISGPKLPQKYLVQFLLKTWFPGWCWKKI